MKLQNLLRESKKMKKYQNQNLPQTCSSMLETLTVSGKAVQMQLRMAKMTTKQICIQFLPERMLRLLRNTYDDLIDRTNAKYVIYQRRIESSQKIPNEEMNDPHKNILPKLREIVPSILKFIEFETLTAVHFSSFKPPTRCAMKRIDLRQFRRALRKALESFPARAFFFRLIRKGNRWKNTQKFLLIVVDLSILLITQCK